MLHTPNAMRRGAIVRLGDQTWMIWHGSVCVPIVRNCAVHHTRYDYVIQPGDVQGLSRKWVARFEHARRIDMTQVALLGVWASADAIQRMAQLVRRCAESVAVEDARKMQYG